ncbi:hypothetical protein F5B22DRAFT_604874 [Xylaria bambusicola]|uniref:uncharacterized protein n=1 Tax=Xylaria bambusicola TaxID=326684 RepID=UPI0020088AC5|nr:uncharacterized protein F5B22DRAFT_604874 [Xylaria bambusicola]KAI0517111.1 hypothetical protein F5B22DRAFT_604874 [Xylaria bambusicola]
MEWLDAQQHASGSNNTIKTNCTSTRGPKGMWRSAWLHKRTLIALIFLLTILAVSLLLLWRYDISNNGIRLALGSNHYIWTYGPTAILTIIVGIWRQIDYQCKSVQPWLCMQDHASPAESTVLLDYISPIQITSFYRAVSQRHWPVACSVLGFATLKLTVLASTSLLFPSDTLMNKTYDSRIVTSFSASRFWDTIPPRNWTGPDRSIPVYGDILSQTQGFEHNPAYSNVSTDPVYAYWGLSRPDFSFPLGTEDGLAFQIFNATNDDGKLSKVSMPVDAFIPNVTCEIPRWTTFQNPSDFSIPIQLELETATCSVGRGRLDSAHFDAVDVVAAPVNNDYCSEDSLPYPASFTIQRVNCEDQSTWNGTTALDHTTQHDFRFAVIAANISETVVEDRVVNTTVTHVVDRSLSQAGVVLCSIDYNIVKARAVQNLEAGTFSVIGDNKGVHGRHLPELSRLEFSELVYASLYSAANIFVPPDRFVLLLPRQDSAASCPLFSVMGSHLDKSKNSEEFFDSATLQNAAQNAFSNIAAQMIQQSFTEKTDIPATSEGEYHEPRLHVNQVSLWILVAGLLVVALATTMIVVTTTRQVIPQDPRSTATHASILAASPSLQALLYESGSLRTSQLKSLLTGFNFRTVLDKRFRIVASQQDAVDDSPSQPKKAKTSIWLPLSAKLPFVALTLSLPVLAIGALEILYRTSIAHKGLADAPVDSDLTSYGIRLSSSLVILLIATLFNSLDFTIVTFAPYGTLRNGAASASRGMLANLQGTTPLLAIYQSVKLGQFGVTLSTLATLIGSLLTVFGSGLWVLDYRATFDSSFTTSASNTWQLTFSDALTAVSGGALLLNNIERNVASSPSNVWNDLVFPQLSELTLSKGSSDFRPDIFDAAALNYTLTLPALRPELDCDTIPNQLINVTTDYRQLTLIEAQWDLPPGCLGGPGGNQTYLNVSYATNSARWFGDFLDAHMGPFSDFIDSQELGEDGVEQADNPFGCPSIVAIFGHINSNRTAQDDVTIFVCNQKIQQVDTTVTYVGHPRDGDINLSQPPVTDESTAIYLTNGTEGVDAFNYRIQDDLREGFEAFNQGPEENFDKFFNRLTHGPDGITREQLLGRENAPRLLEAIQGLYNKYMVQVINLNFRQPIESSKLRRESKSNIIPGTVTREIERLAIHFPSKLALQITLGIMVILSAIAFRLANLRGILPRNPCSIASVMGFFAGSHLCSSGEILPEGAEWMSLEELKECLDGYMFSLGWWTPRERPIDSGTESDTVDADRADMSTGARFGIDVGTPIELGYCAKRVRKRASTDSV